MDGRARGTRSSWAARLLLVGGAVCLLASPALPYWAMQVRAPQYPKGLHLRIYPHRLSGDVREIDGLNHYIGMRPLVQGATTERRLAIPALMLISLGLLLAAALPRRWAVAFTLPAILFPLLFVGDLYWWLRDFGLNLDPHAPLNRAIKPFVPTLLGPGRVGQFASVAWFAGGFYLSVAAAAAAALAALLRFRRAPRAGARLTAAMGIILLPVAWPADAATLVVEPSGAHETIASALEAAAPGDTIVVQGGVHRGPLVLEKPVTLIGERGPVIDGGGRGTVVRVEAPDAVVRGFIVRGSGDRLSTDDAGIVVTGARALVEANRIEGVLFGIDVRHAPHTILRRNVLSGMSLPVARRGDLIRVWYSDHVIIEDNELTGGRDAVLWFSQGLAVRRNVVRRARYGLHFMYCHDSLVEDNDVSDSSVGAYLMYSQRLRLWRNRITGNRGPSGYGIGLKDMDEAAVQDNLIADNRVGVFLDNAVGALEANLIAYNDVGVAMLPSVQQVRFAGNSLVENGEQVAIEGLGSASTTTWRGNFWSDYRGYDADGDGVGELPYRSAQLFEQLADRYPSLRLYADSPAARTLEFAAQLFPLFAPRPMLADEAPRVAPLVPAWLAARQGAGP
ncbi:MAG: nitrous oxide reductase family maturation protein NosD [Candidatus Omnitrophica bacterium]|nr:nitrous oxide reductase family maturation protein NosD [Candidatus Omnitrophota bacterium]MBI2105030.1 nitrous oxide reductase family maturation protein NosD [Candidatus Omnitrophota bacterium]